MSASSATGSGPDTTRGGQLAAAQALAAGAPARAGRTRVIAIDGPSGSGKSTFAAQLAERLGAALVQLEVIYPGWDGLDAGVERALHDVILPLTLGGEPRVVHWDWVAGADGRVEPISVGEVLILDGVGSASSIMRPYLGAALWLEAPEEERRRRAIARDGQRYAPHWERWAAQERVTFARDQTRAYADLILEPAAS